MRYCRVSHVIQNRKHTFTIQVQNEPFKRTMSLDKAFNEKDAEVAARKALRWATEGSKTTSIPASISKG